MGIRGDGESAKTGGRATGRPGKAVKTAAIAVPAAPAAEGSGVPIWFVAVLVASIAVIGAATAVALRSQSDSGTDVQTAGTDASADGSAGGGGGDGDATGVPATTTTTVATRADDEMDTDGIGPIEWGMTYDEVAATGWVGPLDEEFDTCGYATAAPASGVGEQDLSFLFIDRTLFLAYLSSPAITALGHGIGTPSSTIRADFGTDLVEYVDPYETTHLDVLDPDGSGVSYGLDQSGVVRGIEGGLEGGLDLVEGCL